MEKINSLNSSILIDLKSALHCPRLYIAEHFSGLINQLDQEVNSCVDDRNQEITDKKFDHHLSIVSEIKKKEIDILNSISSDFNFESSFKESIFDSIEAYEASLNGQCSEEPANLIYEKLIQIQRILFGDKCFILLNGEIANFLSIYLVHPNHQSRVLFITDDVIGKKVFEDLR